MKHGFKLTQDTINSQDCHDARYHAAIKAGVSHSQAWREERKRRKATLHRKSGVADRAERIRLDKAWHKEFDTKKVKDEEFFDEAHEHVETEAVIPEDGGRMRILRGEAKAVRRGKLKKKDANVFMKSARSYRSLTQDEVSKFKTETKEDERKVMNRKRVNIHKARIRVMTKEKKEARSEGSKEKKGAPPEGKYDVQ